MLTRSFCFGVRSGWAELWRYVILTGIRFPLFPLFTEPCVERELAYPSMEPDKGIGIQFSIFALVGRLSKESLICSRCLRRDIHTGMDRTPDFSRLFARRIRSTKELITGTFREFLISKSWFHEYAICSIVAKRRRVSLFNPFGPGLVSIPPQVVSWNTTLLSRNAITVPPCLEWDITANFTGWLLRTWCSRRVGERPTYSSAECLWDP